MKKQIKQAENQTLRELVESENLKAIKSYLKATPKKIVLQKDAEGRDALYYAIFTRNLDIIKTLIKYGFDPSNIDEPYGASALHLASSEGNFDLVEYLIETVKMDVNALDKEKHNPLHYALLFLNINDTNKTMISSTEHLKIAYMLVKHGAKFQDTMLGMQLELEHFEQALLHLIHNGLKKMDNEHLSKYKNFIQFLTDAQGYYMRFFKDISTELPDGTIYLTRAFKTKEHKIPLAFGWKISDWEFIGTKNKRLIPLTGREIKPMVYDLTEISPLLINQGDTEAEPIVLFYNFESAIQGKLKPTGAKQINIILSQGKIFTPSHYFKQTTNVENPQEAITAIVDLSHEVDRRKKLSKAALKTELPVLCLIDNLSKITNKTAIAELQNIVFAGKDVGVYLIAVAQGKIPNILRANFQSIITFHTATTAESNKYMGCPHATELELDEMLFTSPFADGIQPIHIKMEKM